MFQTELRIVIFVLFMKSCSWNSILLISKYLTTQKAKNPIGLMRPKLFSGYTFRNAHSGIYASKRCTRNKTFEGPKNSPKKNPDLYVFLYARLCHHKTHHRRWNTNVRRPELRNWRALWTKISIILKRVLAKNGVILDPKF